MQLLLTISSSSLSLGNLPLCRRCPLCYQVGKKEMPYFCLMFFYQTVCNSGLVAQEEELVGSNTFNLFYVSSCFIILLLVLNLLAFNSLFLVFMFPG
uniref:Uncharacterized protein n=1 Tax=Anguilla anguilla TaxID=7936 RepID=A0A0E9X274_ANGAN